MSIDTTRTTIAFARSVLGFSDEPQSRADVEESRGFCRGASRREVVASLVGLRELARSFGQIQHDRRRRSCQLVRQMPSPARQPLDDFVREHQKIQRDEVHVETLVIEDHAGSSAARCASCPSIALLATILVSTCPCPCPCPCPISFSGSLEIRDRP